MVTLGRIEFPTLSPIHSKTKIHQAVKIWLCTCTPKMHAHDNDKTEHILLVSILFREK